MTTVGARLRQKLDVSRTACRSDWQPRTAPAPAAEFSASIKMAPAAEVPAAINSHRHTFRVVPAFVNVRDAPSLTAYLLCRRWEGELIEAIEERDGWIRDASEYGSVSGWLLIDGSQLGLGLLLDRVTPDSGPPPTPKPRPNATNLDRYGPLLVRAPKSVPSSGPLPSGVSAPVRRWRGQRPMTLVHAQPSHRAAVVDVVLQGELAWTGKAVAHAVMSDNGDAEDDGANWHRLAVPDGWVHTLCPAGEVQLAPPEAATDYHRQRHDRELEALDLYCQARVAVHQTYGSRGRLQLARMYDAWELEAVQLAREADKAPENWDSLKKDRALLAKSAFAQALLSVCHRDVVLEAQRQAKQMAALPSECRREPLPGEQPLLRSHVQTLLTEDLVVVDGLLPPSAIAQCCKEAEALDAGGHLAPPAMHRALGDRRDRLVGLDEGTELLPRDSALGRLVSYLKSLAFDLSSLGYDEQLTVPASVMLACYDGQGAFYKPHMDSMNSDPRRLTAIVYLVPEDWDADPDADGGQLNWWLVPDEQAGRKTDAVRAEEMKREPPIKQTLNPKAGRLVLFKARTVMHEVLPTHRKRFALTLWYFAGREEGAVELT